VSSLGPLEAETCRDYVVPRLREAGWADEQIVEQYRITGGRVFPTRGRHRRRDPLEADYVLESAPGFPVAVVEAKREYKKPGDGLGQAIRYAMLLDLSLAYSKTVWASSSGTSTQGSRTTRSPPPHHQARHGCATGAGRASGSTRRARSSCRSRVNSATPTAP
jgi:type I site-specific restriction endonuclease